MLNAPERHLPLPGTYNLRDLGGYRSADGRLTRWRSVLRADSLHRLSAEGASHLEEAGLRTVIDLRFDAEKATAPQPFRDRPGIQVVDVALFSKLKTDAMAASGEPDVLLGLYRSALVHCAVEIGDALAAIADAEDGMVLFHCTAGKDRTGILAALLLAAAEVPDEMIVADYALTARLCEPLFKELLEDMVARGQARERAQRLLLSEPATMRATLEHLATEYGGAGGYLDEVGLDSHQVARLRARLLAA